MKEGGKVEFTCLTKGRVMWYKEKGVFIPNPKPKPLHVGKVFVIESVKESDKGYYQCHGLNENEDEFHGRVQLKVECMFLKHN